MEYNEQFIRLNCNLMLDYKMMKLNAEMKCVGMGLYMNMLLFLRKQNEYKHSFDDLDFLAKQWGCRVEKLHHLIEDFDLFEITEDGYFRCLYLDELMDYQHKISEERAAAGSKGGRSCKKNAGKTTVKAAAKATVKPAAKPAAKPAVETTVEPAVETTVEPAVETTVKSCVEAPEKASVPASEKEEKGMKNTVEKSEEEKATGNVAQLSDNECDAMSAQASCKQNPIREEKNREEKNNSNNRNEERNAVTAITAIDDLSKNTAPVPRWEQCIDEAFATRSWVETVGMMSGLKERFLNNIPFICDLFKKHVVAQGNTGGINSLSDAESYFANYIRTGKPTRLFLEEKLKERDMAQSASSFSPYENYDPLTGLRSYYGIPLPADAPPRPNGRSSWDELKKCWI